MVLLKQWLKCIVEHVVIGLLDGNILKIHVRMSILIAGVDPFGTFLRVINAPKLVLYTLGIPDNFRQTNNYFRSLKLILE